MLLINILRAIDWLNSPKALKTGREIIDLLPAREKNNYIKLIEACNDFNCRYAKFYGTAYFSLFHSGTQKMGTGYQLELHAQFQELYRAVLLKARPDIELKQLDVAGMVSALNQLAQTLLPANPIKCMQSILAERRWESDDAKVEQVSQAIEALTDRGKGHDLYSIYLSLKIQRCPDLAKKLKQKFPNLLRNRSTENRSLTPLNRFLSKEFTQINMQRLFEYYNLNRSIEEDMICGLIEGASQLIDKALLSQNQADLQFSSLLRQIETMPKGRLKLRFISTLIKKLLADSLIHPKIEILSINLIKQLDVASKLVLIPDLIQATEKCTDSHRTNLLIILLAISNWMHSPEEWQLAHQVVNAIPEAKYRLEYMALLTHCKNFKKICQKLKQTVYCQLVTKREEETPDELRDTSCNIFKHIYLEILSIAYPKIRFNEMTLDQLAERLNVLANQENCENDDINKFLFQYVNDKQSQEHLVANLTQHDAFLNKKMLDKIILFAKLHEEPMVPILKAIFINLLESENTSYLNGNDFHMALESCGLLEKVNSQ